MSIHTTAAAWVRFLRNYGPIPTNDNMYDESIQRALKRHKILPITLPAPLVRRLVENFQADAPASHIITGTAGDGKTYHCREVWVALGGDPATWNEGAKVQTLAVGSRTLVIVKDMSELRDEESAQLIADFARDVADRQATTFYLLAANHGQLLEKLKSAPHTPEIKRVTTVVEELLVTGNNPDPAISVDLDDLSRSPAAEMVTTIIDEVTNHEGWEGCGSCAANMGDAICPIYENRRRLMGEGEGWNGLSATVRRCASSDRLLLCAAMLSLPPRRLSTGSFPAT